MTVPSGWRPMRADDLAEVERIADIVHADYPERPEIFAERFAMFPQGCFVTGGGYAIAHPARLGEPPALDGLMGGTPAGADALHVHDVALLPELRGRGLGSAALLAFRALAQAHGYARMSLVSVHGSGPYWARFGFADSPASAALASYGAEARYMVCRSAA
jgi:GNAT superfamily N-acetyltransferase